MSSLPLAPNGGQLVDVLARERAALDHGTHHQPEAPAVDLAEEALGLGAGGVALLDGRIKLLGTRALLVTHRALGLQPREHGDDGVLLPSGFLSQGGGKLCDGLRRTIPETVHQLPLRVGQIAGHRTFLLSVYGCIPI